MKLIKQKKLYFVEGKSDKVYEVDLCESGSDLFVVNFRYGRRGANLREGTKTVFPVTYEEAIKTFDALVKSKEKKGYSESLALNTETKSVQEVASVNTEREETILKYLKQAAQGIYTRNWKVSRIILRALQLQITSAIPEIIHFVKSEDEFEQYNAIKALAEFKNKDALNVVVEVFNEKGFRCKVGRIAAAYVLNYGDDSLKLTVIEAAQKNVPQEFLNQPAIYFLKDSGVDAMALYYAYIVAINNVKLKEQLYQLIEGLPLKVNTFKSVRYIYRASQLLNDNVFCALISKRIAINKPGYTSEYVYADANWTSVSEEKKKANPSIAFSAKTKAYFNKATYSYVYNLSQKNTEEYIRFATQLLIVLNDQEDKTVETSQILYDYNYDTRNYETEKRYYPKYHDFMALMYVLYGNSSRFKQQSQKWYYTDVIDSGGFLREEVLQEIWNNKPDEVLQILANSKSGVAVNFSLRIIQDNKHFLDKLSDKLITRLINHENAEVVDMVVEVLEDKYKNTTPEQEVVFALLKSRNQKAIDLALSWLKKHEASYFVSSAIIEGLLLTAELQAIHYLELLYKESVPYNLPLQIEVLYPFFKTPNNYGNDYLLNVNNLIGNTHFGKLLSSTPEEKIKELAKSDVVSNKLFAANLSKHNSVPALELFKDTFDDYINSENENLRRVGVELLAHFPDDFLIENNHRIGAFCFSEYIEVREAIQPTIDKLVKLDENFKKRLLNQLLGAISEAEQYEGLHENCYAVLVKYYDKNLPLISEEEIIKLVLSKYEFAQKLGLPLFEERIDLEQLTMSQLIKLSKSDVFVIREKLRAYFNANTSRVNYELEEALQIFNSNWDDIIEWSCNYFNEYIEPKNWTVDMLLYLCDHTKSKAQALGRLLVTRHFSEDKGLPLVLKLQEHPTKDMQFFVTNYLDNYATGNEEVILSMESYFKTCLFGINSHRNTKTRVYSFLEKEIGKSQAVAKMVVRIISAVLGTKTLIDKSSNIDLLLAVHENYPELELPLVINKELTNEV